jgi:endonuclease YncB( thermonuclease family)
MLPEQRPEHPHEVSMNLEGLTLSATPLAFAAALAACDVRAEAASICGGSSGGIGPAEVARVVDGRSLVLADGREVRLAGIETLLPVAGDEDEARAEAALAAKTALEALVLRREIDILPENAGSDRYGRVIAYASVHAASGAVLVQRELVASGHALASPGVAPACRVLLRNAEQAARARKLGLWGEPYSVLKNASDPADILADQGRFAVVQGRVASVRESAGIVYINFGQRWSDQFTATILKRNEGSFAGAGVTPKSLAGRTIEVRGWIEEHGGPAVEVTRPDQIDIIH